MPIFTIAADATTAGHDYLRRGCRHIIWFVIYLRQTPAISLRHYYLRLHQVADSYHRPQASSGIIVSPTPSGITTVIALYRRLFQ